MGLTKLKHQYGKLSNNFHSQQSIEAFPFDLEHFNFFYTINYCFVTIIIRLSDFLIFNISLI